eukprot:9547670-Alexandrium_andersonii.AAC.1
MSAQRCWSLDPLACPQVVQAALQLASRLPGPNAGRRRTPGRTTTIGGVRFKARLPALHKRSRPWYGRQLVFRRRNDSCISCLSAKLQVTKRALAMRHRGVQHGEWDAGGPPPSNSSCVFVSGRSGAPCISESQGGWAVHPRT